MRFCKNNYKLETFNDKFYFDKNKKETTTQRHSWWKTAHR